MDKILIINKAGTNYTGAKVRNTNIAIELSKRDKKIYLLAIDQLEIYEKGKKILQKKISLFNFFIIFFKKYKLWLCDIVIFSLFLKRNLFFTIHDNKEWTAHGRVGLLKKILIYLIVKKSKICITVSKKLSIFFSNKFKKKFYVITNGLSSEWRKKAKKIKLAEKYLIYVSNYMTHKNHLSLLKIQKYLNYKIILVGEPMGIEGRKICKILRRNKNFKFIFNPSTSRLQSLVKQSDFVLFPSKLEGFGMPIIESLSQKKSVLIQKDLKKQLPMFSKCRKLFFHDYSKKIELFEIKKLLTKKSCKNCIYTLFDWRKIVEDLDKIIKKI